jgi:hypothetical protein
LAKLCVRTCCRRHESCSSRSLPSMDDGTDDETDGWMKRTTLRGQNQVYYISRLVCRKYFHLNPPNLYHCVHFHHVEHYSHFNMKGLV